MPTDGSNADYLFLPRLGTAIAVVALVCPMLRLPLALACLAGLGWLARSREGGEMIGRTEPPRETLSRRRQRDNGVSSASEDSFPASDPPSWTPVSGTGSHH